MIIQSLPSRDSSKSFQTFLNYLFSISNFLDQIHASERFKEVIDSPTFKKINATSFDVTAVRRHLMIAWSTELQLNLLLEHPTLIPYSNHWGPVQLYYAAYLSLRALFKSMNVDIKGNHRPNLTNISDCIAKRSDLFPHPWKILCINHKVHASNSFLRIPVSIEINNLHNLSNEAKIDFWNSYCKFLRTTRSIEIDRLVVEWKTRNKLERIPKIKRMEIEAGYRATSFFDCLYRLRIRSNYEDAETYLETIKDSQESLDFYHAMRNICWHTLQSVELLIARHVKKSLFSTWVSEFCSVEGGTYSIQLVQRRWLQIHDLW